MQKTLKFEVNEQIAFKLFKDWSDYRSKISDYLMPDHDLSSVDAVVLWCASCQYVFVKVSGTDAVIRYRSLDDSIAKLESQNLSKVVSCPGIKLFLAQLCPSRLFVHISCIVWRSVRKFA